MSTETDPTGGAPVDSRKRADERSLSRGTRREDARLPTQKGRFVAGIDRPGHLDAAFVRSGVAHGPLRAADRTAARAVPGAGEPGRQQGTAPGFAHPAGRALGPGTPERPSYAAGTSEVRWRTTGARTSPLR
ncbi:hypothetical protein Shyhy01_23840 [Streptomyces hygroscopicus subsp. hygroscopicus]|nr:hypothetical protein Shyhy01_23840 [Streptomyces hygroscopicus subsp. hygroscopicus]